MRECLRSGGQPLVDNDWGELEFVADMSTLEWMVSGYRRSASQEQEDCCRILDPQLTECS